VSKRSGLDVRQRGGPYDRQFPSSSSPPPDFITARHQQPHRGRVGEFMAASMTQTLAFNRQPPARSSLAVSYYCRVPPSSRTAFGRRDQLCRPPRRPEPLLWRSADDLHSSLTATPRTTHHHGPDRFPTPPIPPPAALPLRATPLLHQFFQESASDRHLPVTELGGRLRYVRSPLFRTGDHNHIPLPEHPIHGPQRYLEMFLRTIAAACCMRKEPTRHHSGIAGPGTLLDLT